MARDEDVGLEIEPGEELEDDLTTIDLDAVRSAFVSGSDWTVETILRQMRNGNIDLNPRFQRRDVWNPFQKSQFIESILLNLPIPQLVLAENRSDRNTFIVLDGKQRLLTLRQFAASRAIPEDDGFDSLQLSRLDIRTDLSGMTYWDLAERLDRNAFDNHTIRTVVLRNWPDDAFLYRVFLRLNTGSVRLNPQELRLALNPGPFMEFLDEYASENPQVRAALGLKKADRRMRDTEITLRYLALTNYLNLYEGKLLQFLDMACALLSDRWLLDQLGVIDQLKDFEVAIETTIAIFGERDAFTRWRNNRYERPFNRAIFDVMTYWFRFPEVAEASQGKTAEVETAFQDLCVTDRDFDESISTTTKTPWALSYRLSRWRDVLNDVLGNVPPKSRWLVETSTR